MRTRLIAALAALCISLATQAQSIEDEAFDWLREYIRIDTVNPPGNESRAVEFYARILDAAGIPFRTAESAPGRGNIWARLEGGDEPALILLQHTDVVPADRSYWTVDPLGGSNKINVVPPEAWAEIDCRILPDRPSEIFVDQLRDMIDGTGVDIEVIMAFTPAVSSTSTRLYEAIEEVTSERYPGSRVMPSVASGFTDSHFTRDLGIASYGFDPIIASDAEFSRIHGNDERVAIDAFKRGVIDHLAIIGNVVYDQAR